MNSSRHRSLFHDSEDEEFVGFAGDLNDLEADDASAEEYVFCVDLDPNKLMCSSTSDDLLGGTVQELDLGSDDEEVTLLPLKPNKSKGKSKQLERPLKIIPTGSDMSSDEDSDEDGPVTIANMEARSRAMDDKAAQEAELDADELRNAELAGAADGDLGDIDDEDADMEGDEEQDAFQLPTAEERDAEKKSGAADVHVVQRRMRECVRILGNFKNRAAKGRWVMFSILRKGADSHNQLAH